jgi:hypothetical protein
MSGLLTLRARLARLEAREPSPVRRFIVVVRAPDQAAAGLVEALEALGEVVTISTGVPRDPLDGETPAPVVWELAADGRWLAAKPEGLAA